MKQEVNIKLPFVSDNPINHSSIHVPRPKQGRSITKMGTSLYATSLQNFGCGDVDNITNSCN
ncbi:MAG: hypothetical protein O4803_10860 [Trichodesmium sp. St15_bin1_1]|nr:hypothetical protein [Trichodesmium sp. St5_bin2_1]MDE5088128.1 hypothetical protein [Trichodesmium sp. St16_bin2-tuft]MDE5114725.1 hypothetical protein [Trichodesmium sp. St15_bin1_1]